MATVRVDPGICGLKSIVTVMSEDCQTCEVKIESECEAIRALAQDLKTLDGFDAAFKPFAENPVYIAAGKNYKHAACPVPSAIIKAAEIACALALPMNVEFIVEK
ncbi:MAG: hypothetical protein WCT14_18825 [Treponemataceae bacterium]